MNKPSQLIKDSIIPVLQAHQSQISFAYLFGSAVTDYYRPGESDVDVGIYFKKEVMLEEILDLEAKLQEAIPSHPEVDVIAMNQAGLIINQQICTEGQLLVEFDHKFHEQFRLTQWSMYIDFKRSRRSLEEGLTRPVWPKNSDHAS